LRVSPGKRPNIGDEFSAKAEVGQDKADDDNKADDVDDGVHGFLLAFGWPTWRLMSSDHLSAAAV
jgi:hypothetical protein